MNHYWIDWFKLQDWQYLLEICETFYNKNLLLNKQNSNIKNNTFLYIILY